MQHFGSERVKFHTSFLDLFVVTNRTQTRTPKRKQTIIKIFQKPTKTWKGKKNMQEIMQHFAKPLKTRIPSTMPK